MSIFAVYDSENLGIDSIEADSDIEAIKEFERKNPTIDIEGFWAEEVDA